MAKQAEGTQSGRARGKLVYSSRRRAYDPAAWERAYAQKRAMEQHVPFSFALPAATAERLRAVRVAVWISNRGG